MRLLDRASGLARAQLTLRGCRTGARVWAGGPLHVVDRGRIEIGDRVQLGGGIVPTELVCDEGALLRIGPRCILNWGVSIRASQSVEIGADCFIGSMARVRDHDGREARPVHIGDRVWLAHGAMIEPGVRIGDGAVVSAGSVVLADVPAGMLACGNPARCMPLDLFQHR